jgi:hypothetical protein
LLRKGKAPVRFETTPGHDSPVRITTLDLHGCDMKGRHAGWLAAVLAQCPALAQLDLGSNPFRRRREPCRSAGAVRRASSPQSPLSWDRSRRSIEACRSAGALQQCPALTHLNLEYNGIEDVGKGRLRVSWRGPASGLRL